MVRTATRLRPALRVLLALACGAGCAGSQSALDPAGADAERIAQLFWIMSGSALVIWLAVVGLAVYASHLAPGPHPRASRWLIVGGGVVFPTVTLAALLVYGLAMLPDLLDPGDAGGARITVVGEQWWWRVRYDLPDGRAFELANELALTVGRRVPVVLQARDVIHAFWIPAIGGKMDMIPGRDNLLGLEPTRIGVYRGACAEYCGASHAHMELFAQVVSAEAFDEWADRQAADAQPPATALEARGAELFATNGCGACHAVRGTEADGTFGPDLTHVGGRLSIGAGLLPNDVDGFARWLSDTRGLKPEVHMPTFDMLPEDDRTALAAWLDGLE